MATYNGAYFVKDQLESIANQTRPPSRLIISDDGSSDHTLEIIEKFRRRCRFDVTVIEGPQEGLAANFWHAASAITTDYIAWSDQDDVWYPSKIEESLRVLEAGIADFVSHSAETIDSDGASLGHLFPAYRRTRIFEALEGDPWHVPSGFATTFRTSLLEGLPFDERPRSHQTGRLANHDHVVSLAAFASVKRAEISRPLAGYRQHQHNAAGDPTTRGLQTVAIAKAVGARSYEEAANIAREQGLFVAQVRRAHPHAAEYFNLLADQFERRAALHKAPTFKDRVSGLVRSMAHHDYRSRDLGGFSGRSLARDTYKVLLNR